MAETRKVIQIATLPDGPHNVAAIVALCDDGTMWICGITANGWTPVVAVPQPTPSPAVSHG